MTILDQFDRQTIEANMENASTGEVTLRHIPCWCFGELAAYELGGKWRIILKPLGYCLHQDLLTFLSVEDVCGAILELSRLRNTWANLFQEKANPRDPLVIKMTEIAIRHHSVGIYAGGSVSWIKGGVKKKPLTPVFLNGARKEDYE